MQLSTSIPSTSHDYPYSTTFTQSTQTSIPKGSQDLRPTRKGHAAPAIMGCDAEHNLSRDARPANQGLYAAPATPGCDVEPTDQCTYHPPCKSGYIPPHLRRSVPTHSTASSSTFSHHAQPATIQSIDDNVSLWSGNKNDVLRILRSTVNLEERKALFPRQSEEHPSMQGQQCRFALHPDYTSHLVSVMAWSSDVINSFLQATGAKTLFSYGSSKFYENQPFEKVLHYEWPAPTIAWGFEKCLLLRIATAYKILNQFLHTTDEVPDLSTHCSLYPTSMNPGKYLVVISPSQEDALWNGEVADLVQAVINLRTFSNSAEGPNVIAPTRRPCAMPPTSSSIPECLLPTTEVSMPLINIDHLPSSQTRSPSDPEGDGYKNHVKTESQQAKDFDSQPSWERAHDHPLDPEDAQWSIMSRLEWRSPDHSTIPKSCCSKAYVKDTYKATGPQAKNQTWISRLLVDLQLNPKAACQELITQPLRDPDKAMTKLGIRSDVDTITPSCNPNSQLQGSENPREDLQRLHRTPAWLPWNPNTFPIMNSPSPGILHSPDSWHPMAGKDSHLSPNPGATNSWADITDQLWTSWLLLLLDARITNQEPTIQPPRNPDKIKMPIVFHTSSRDDTSYSKKLSPFSMPTMPIRRLNTAELSAAQDTLAHLYDWPPPSLAPLSAPMTAAAEKSWKTSMAQKATTRVYDPPASEPGLPAISKEPVKTVPVIRPLRDPDKLSTPSLEWLCYLKATPTSQNPQVKDQSGISRSHLSLPFDKVANQESAIQLLHDPDKHSTLRYLCPRLNTDIDHPDLVHAQEHDIVLQVCSISQYNGSLTWELSTTKGNHLTDKLDLTYHSPSVECSTLCQYEYARTRASRHAIAAYSMVKQVIPHDTDIRMSGVELQTQEIEDLSDASHSWSASSVVTLSHQLHDEHLQCPLPHKATQQSHPWLHFSELQHKAADHHLRAGCGCSI